MLASASSVIMPNRCVVVGDPRNGLTARLRSTRNGQPTLPVISPVLPNRSSDFPSDRARAKRRRARSLRRGADRAPRRLDADAYGNVAPDSSRHRARPHRHHVARGGADAADGRVRGGRGRDLRLARRELRRPAFRGCGLGARSPPDMARARRSGAGSDGRWRAASRGRRPTSRAEPARSFRSPARATSAAGWPDRHGGGGGPPDPGLVPRRRRPAGARPCPRADRGRPCSLGQFGHVALPPVPRSFRT